jgi:hypothetical protein
VLAVDTGDDAAPLLAGISDPFLHAVAQLAMAWTLPIAADLDGALREAAVSLEELRGQDEPVFMGMAAFTVGSQKVALGRYDDALPHLREARDLAQRMGGDWLAAGPRVQLDIPAVLRGRLDEARPLLDEALDLSLAARSTPFVTLCLVGYAQLAFADGDPDRAALLEGAAEGLRRRVGQPARPRLRRVERPGGPGTPQARRQPVRSGVLCRLRARPARRGRRRPRPARHPGTLSRSA